MPETEAGQIIVGVDVGGTKIAVLVTEGGTREVARARFITDRDSSDSTAGSIADAIATVLAQNGFAKQQVSAVGIAAPGEIDAEAGLVRFAANLPFRNYDLRAALRRMLDLAEQIPIVVDNDANLAALGEQYYGAGRGTRHMVMITLGTGIGGGVIINNRVYRGGRGFAGELGHIILETNGWQCGCGQRGCFETLASGPAVVRHARTILEQQPDPTLEAYGSNLTGADVANEARKGNRTALAVHERVGFYLGLGILSIYRAFDPEAIIIGGGLSSAADLILDPARRTVHEYASGNISYVNDLIRLAELGEDAGMWGAVALANSARNRDGA